MGRIVAIAGGNLLSTREINIYTIKLTNVNNPNVLFIPWTNEMLDIIHLAYCPHYEDEERKSFAEMLIEKNIPGLAMECDTA